MRQEDEKQRNAAPELSETEDLMREYLEQTESGDEHSYSVYGVDSHSDSGCCC